MTTTHHWSTVYLEKNHKKVQVAPLNMTLIIYIKYELGEITFLELKDRVRAINLLSEWVDGFFVKEKAYTRFRHGGLVSPEVNSHFLKMFHQKKFKNIDSYGVEDFPRMTLLEDDSTELIEQDTL